MPCVRVCVVQSEQNANSYIWSCLNHEKGKSFEPIVIARRPIISLMSCVLHAWRALDWAGKRGWGGDMVGELACIVSALAACSDTSDQRIIKIIIPCVYIRYPSGLFVMFFLAIVDGTNAADW